MIEEIGQRGVNLTQGQLRELARDLFRGEAFELVLDGDILDPNSSAHDINPRFAACADPRLEMLLH